MKKRLLSITFATILAAAAITGCSTKSADPTTATTAAVAAAGETKEATKSTNKDFPKKNVKIIVPYDAGGGVDITTRLLVDAAGKDYFNGKSLVVENMGGGGAVIGHTYVANADPDGYTLLAYTSAVVNNPVLKDVTYTLDSFRTLGMVCFDPEVLVVPPTSNYKTFDEFVEYAKNNTVKLATPGHSTAHHIAAIKLSQMLDLKFEYLHNDSASIQKQQLMGGHCDAAMMAIGEVVGDLTDGTIVALAMGGEERIDTAPDVPTFTECGVDLVDGAFRGFACPKSVPDDIYQVLVEQFDEIIQSQTFIDKMNEANIPYSYMSAADFQKYAEECSAALEEIAPTLK